MRRLIPALGLVLGPGLGLGACGGAGPGAASAPAPGERQGGGESVRGSTEAEIFFPLRDGHVYHYAVTQGEGGGRLLFLQAFRRSPAGGELRPADGPARVFEYLPEGVRIVAPRKGFVLKRPFSVGTSWRGEHGGKASIARTGVRITVPAGSFDGCLVTVEERGGDRPMRLETTFCPDVGIVAMEASSGAAYERAELKSFGPPVDLGPDGVRRFPVNPGGS